jgi:hypothetical protein
VPESRGIYLSPSWILVSSFCPTPLIVSANCRITSASPRNFCPRSFRHASAEACGWSGKRCRYAPVEKHFQERSAEPQIPPLRYAAVEMTLRDCVRIDPSAAKAALFGGVLMAGLKRPRENLSVQFASRPRTGPRSSHADTEAPPLRDWRLQQGFDFLFRKSYRWASPVVFADTNRFVAHFSSPTKRRNVCYWTPGNQCKAFWW